MMQSAFGGRPSEKKEITVVLRQTHWRTMKQAAPKEENAEKALRSSCAIEKHLLPQSVQSHCTLNHCAVLYLYGKTKTLPK